MPRVSSHLGCFSTAYRGEYQVGKQLHVEVGESGMTAMLGGPSEPVAAAQLCVSSRCGRVFLVQWPSARRGT